MAHAYGQCRVHIEFLIFVRFSLFDPPCGQLVAYLIGFCTCEIKKFLFNNFVAFISFVRRLHTTLFDY